MQGNEASDYKKKNFIAVAFSGVFSPTRAKNNLEKHSNLICIDLDKLNNLQAVQSQLVQDNYTYICFVSPSGNGLKVVFRINMSNDTKNENQTHEKYFASIESYFLATYQLQIDKACKNVDRLCFLPFDENIFINEACDYFLLPQEEKKQASKEEPKQSENRDENGFEWCLEQILKSETFTSGNRNKFVNSLAWYCNTKGIDQEICLYKCLDRFVESGFTKEEITSIVRSVYQHKEKFNEKPYTEKTSSQKKSAKNTYSSFLTSEDLEQELRKRQSVKKPAPLDVFPPEIFPFLNELQTYFKCEKSYILLSVIAAASAAIGSQYRVKAGTLEQGLNIWACNVGISSGSKSLTLSQAFKPLFNLSETFANEFMKERMSYDTLTKEEKAAAEEPIRKVIFSENETFESLVRTLQYNRKGFTKFEDELTSWIEAMGMYKNNNGVEKDFWIKSFTPAMGFNFQRASGTFIFVPKERFILSVAGGTQPKLVHKFFHKNLLEQGFPNRMLFALPETVRLVFPDLEYKMSEQVYKPYHDTIIRLYKELPPLGTPYIAEIKKEGIQLIKVWQKKAEQEFEDIDYEKDSFWKEVFAGIAGKQSQYIIKLSLIFKLLHHAASGKDLHQIKEIESEFVAMAIRAGEYFMESYLTVTKLFQSQDVIPREVVEFATVYKTCKHNVTKTADELGVTRATVYDWLKKYRSQYAKVFEAKA